MRASAKSAMLQARKGLKDGFLSCPVLGLFLQDNCAVRDGRRVDQVVLNRSADIASSQQRPASWANDVCRRGSPKAEYRAGAVLDNGPLDKKKQLVYIEIINMSILFSCFPPNSLICSAFAASRLRLQTPALAFALSFVREGPGLLQSSAVTYGGILLHHTPRANNPR